MNTNKRGHISGGYCSSFTDKYLLDDSGTHPTFDLTIIGKAMRLHQNDVVAQYFEEGNHLINHVDGVSAEFEVESKQPLNKCCDYYNDGIPDNSTQEGLILMDRYDGRSLLQECCVGPSENNKNNDNFSITYPGDNEENETVMQELMMERFGSLSEYEELFCISQKTTTTTSKPPTNVTTKQIVNKLPASQKETFVLPKETLAKLPHGITLPQTRRQNQVISMAAEKSVATPQFEVLLKVKQSNNQEFTFLHEKDQLNPYYMYLKQQEQRKIKRGNLEDDSNVSHSKEESRLLVGYESSSSDDINYTTSGRSKGSVILAGYSSSDDDEESVKIEPALSAANPSEEQVSLPSGEASEKERRLKRARLLQGHFALKMLDR